MNIQKSFAAVAVAVLMAAAMPTLNWAQDSEDSLDDLISTEVEAKVREQEKIVRRAEEQAHKQAAKVHQAMIKAAKNSNHDFNIFVKVGEGSVPLAMKIREASAKVRHANDDEAREKATQELASALDEYFEQDMQARSKDLENIRSRLMKLESQFDHRRQKKNEIIDLQMKVALNEADGLGFYSESQDRMFNFPQPPPATWNIQERIPAPAPVPVPVAGTISVPSPPSPPLPTLRRGSEGISVRLLQTALNSHVKPSPKIDIDGDFGPKTEAAVKEFQAQRELEPTGIVDEETWEAFGVTERMPGPQK